MEAVKPTAVEVVNTCAYAASGASAPILPVMQERHSQAWLMMQCANLQECARYLETYKAYENKPADNIRGRTDEDYLSRLQAALTCVRGVNRTDVLTMGATFKSAAGIMEASLDDLAACPGIGPTKVCTSPFTLQSYEGFYSGVEAILDICNSLQTLPAEFFSPGSIRLHDVQIQIQSKFT